MLNDNTVELFLEYLKGNINVSFMSNVFIALRDNDKKYIFDKDEALKYILSLKGNEVYKLEYYNEDSHTIVLLNDRILKLRFDEFGLIESIVEEFFDIEKENMVFVIEYDGTNYFGMQKQNDGKKSVQGEFEEAIFNMLNKRIDTIISSRTDRGVHAKGQVIEFSYHGIEPKRFMYVLNNLLPSDIRIKDAYKGSQLFNARYDVIKKEYEYIISTNDYSVFKKDYCLFYKIKNIERMKEELKSLIGTHDFIAFCKGENENTIRTIYEASLYEIDGEIHLKFVGSGFLHNMIRLIVGMLLEIDDGENITMKELIDSKDKRKTYRLASASGLYLIKIDY